MSRFSQHDPRQSTKKSHKVRKVCVKLGNSESSSEEEFIFTLRSTSKHNTPLIQISVNNIPINTVIDTGASNDIIDEHTFNTVRQNAPIALQSSSTRIFAYGATTQLPVMGKFEATLACSPGSTTSQIHVIKGNFGCLLSYQTASASGLIMININKLQPEYTGHEQSLNMLTTLMELVPSRILKSNCTSMKMFPQLINPLVEFPFTCVKRYQKLWTSLSVMELLKRL